MKGIEKLTPVRLAEVLTQKGLVATEAITDALYAQEKQGEAFCQVLVNGGHITEWDLTKVVTETFQLPFIMASTYEIEDEVKTKLPKEVLFRELLVPLDLYDSVLTVVMPVLTPFDKIAKIQKEHSVEIFPYVGLFSENRTVLTSLFDDFAGWLKEEEVRKEKLANAASKEGSSSPDWTNIFDQGDQAIKKGL